MVSKKDKKSSLQKRAWILVSSLCLSEGASGNPAVVEDVVAYAERIGSPDFPILAGGDGSVADATPLSQIAHPEICVFTPEFEIVECF